MKKILNKLSILIIFTLMLQLTLPLTSSANTQNELDLIRQETNLTEDDIQLSLDIISEHSSLFLENADVNVLNSYGLEDQNIALLKYFYDINYPSITLHAFAVSQNVSNNDNIQPRVANVLIRVLIKDALKKKMGDKIKKEIGDEVKDKVQDKWIAAAEKEIDKHGYSKFVGPEGSGANGIRQGEHVFEIYGKNGNSIIRGHVGLEQNKAVTNWHYHLKYDNFVDHHEQILLRHRSLPNWGTPN
ncbi:YpjP family protein [Lysinibacillus fusiformis]|uniref:YpjP family protein n=2 Tax=Lysinibacillus fusiformis TaxID=28031 RepID=UPI000D3AA104|nr:MULTISPECIES: YpjP family protein [Lysinibacillus]MCG7435665.1 hypothetical protein [Lysinibacillus fusiformis]MED4670500.1 YpjP family protein [Lysinibacillus fusiformis]QAS56735.1 hypothetical protein LSP_10350 [Lysinibacillus sphaericus]GED62731.1 hypothetical protein LFU01_11830 [Lysinibacillus fusiformis]